MVGSVGETNERHPITLSSSIPFISVISPSILSSLKKICRVRETRKVRPCSVPPRSSPPPSPLSPQTNFPHPSFQPSPPSALPPSSPDVLWALNKKTLFCLHQAGRARRGGGKRKGRSGSNFPLVSSPLKLFLCEYITGFTQRGGKGRSVAIEELPMSA